MKVADKKPAYVMFKKKDRGVRITWYFTTQVNQHENGVWDCSIPEFEFYFNASSQEEVDKKSLGFMRMFFEYYLEPASGDNKNALRSLSTQLIRLGFRSTNGVADMAKLSRNKIVPTKFSSPRIAVQEGVKEFEMKGELVA